MLYNLHASRLQKRGYRDRVRYTLALLCLVVLGTAPSVGANAAATCSGNADARIELQTSGPAPAYVTLEAGRELDFVNESDGPLTVALGDGALLQPGECVAVVLAAGDYSYTVGGYAAGDARGWIYVTPAAVVTIAPHASIAFGERTVLSGTAGGLADARVTVWARPLDVSRRTQIAVISPVHGMWRLNVAPQVGTEYTVGFGGAQDQRVLRVRPDVRVRRTGHTIVVSVTARLAHPAVWLFRFTPSRLMLWTGFRSATAGSNGLVTFKHVPSGRYYAGVLGGSLYLDNASEPFNVRR